MSPLPKMSPVAQPKAPLREPPGFDRAAACKIESSGTPAAPVFKIYSTKGTLLGATDSMGKAKLMRDAFPLDKLFL